MRESQGHEWLTGWTRERPPTLERSFVPSEAWAITTGLRGHLEFRDSGLAEATSGALGTQYVRFIGDPAVADHGWHAHDLDFQFFYVLQGSMVSEVGPGELHTVSAGDAGYLPGLFWHSEHSFSADYEAIALRSPAAIETFNDPSAPLPERERELEPERCAVITATHVDDGVAGGPGRLLCCDLGTREPTGGRIVMHVVGAGPSGVDTGWDVCTGAQWIVVVAGAAELYVDEDAPRRLQRLDSMRIEPNVRTRCSSPSGFRALRLVIPV